jgi:hypothetical protein
MTAIQDITQDAKDLGAAKTIGGKLGQKKIADD